MQLIPYLNFNGNCREAMTFYKKCLGGKLSLRTVGESPMTYKFPALMRECILHSTLATNGIIIMGSDMVPDTHLLRGNANSLMVNCDSEEEINSVFKNLSAGGQVTQLIAKTYWGALFTEFADRFGNNWMLSFEKNSITKNIKK